MMSVALTQCLHIRVFVSVCVFVCPYLIWVNFIHKLNVDNFLVKFSNFNLIIYKTHAPTFYNFQKTIVCHRDERARGVCYIRIMQWTNEIRILLGNICLSMCVRSGTFKIQRSVNKTTVSKLRTHERTHTNKQIKMWHNIPLDWIWYEKYSWCWWHFGSNFDNICTTICVIELDCVRASACVCV